MYIYIFIYIYDLYIYICSLSFGHSTATNWSNKFPQELRSYCNSPTCRWINNKKPKGWLTSLDQIRNLCPSTNLINQPGPGFHVWDVFGSHFSRLATFWWWNSPCAMTSESSTDIAGWCFLVECADFGINYKDRLILTKEKRLNTKWIEWLGLFVELTSFFSRDFSSPELQGVCFWMTRWMICLL